MQDQTVRSPDDHRAVDALSGRHTVNAGSLLCDVCGKPIEPMDSAVWIESYAPDDDPQQVPAHENCRNHTCYGMNAPKENGE